MVKRLKETTSKTASKAEEGRFYMNIRDDMREEEILKHRALLMIDKYDLDTAAEQHAEQIFRISEKVEEMISMRDQAKMMLSEAEAEADAQIRRDAQIADEKVTADQVKALVKMDRNVKGYTAAYNELSYLTRRWQSLKEALLERGKMIRELTSLYANNYWSDVGSGKRRDRDGEDARKAMAEERRARKS